MKTILFFASTPMVSCAVNLDVPEDGQVLCMSDAECPPNFRCQIPAGRCIPQSGDDTLAPQLLASVLNRSVARAGERLELSVEINETLLFPPVVTMGENASTDWILIQRAGSDARPLYRFDYTVIGTESEAVPQTLSLGMTDEAGNDAVVELPLVLVFDFTAPQPETAPSLSYVALGENPLDSVSALGALVEAVVETDADEILSRGVLHVQQENSSILELPCEVFIQELRCLVDIERGDGLDDGEYQLALTLTDTAGNQSGLQAVGPLHIDTEAPAVPDILHENAIVYTRIPWLESEEGEFSSSFSIVGSAGSVEAQAHVQIATQGNTAIIASSIADAQGAFGKLAEPEVPLELGNIDHEAVRIRAIDSAGNASAWVGVRNVDWVVTMAGKEAGETFVNPHRFERRARFSEQRLRTAVVVEASGNTLSRIEGASLNVVSTDGAAEWEQVQSGAVNNFEPSAMGANPITGELLLLESTGNTFVRKTSGIKRVPFEDNEGDGEPAPRSESAVAFEGARASMLLFGGRNLSNVFGDTWRWTGRSWTKACAETVCEGPVPRYGHTMAYDPLRRKTLLFGGRDADNIAFLDLWAFEDGSWSLLCDGGSCADALPNDLTWADLAFDPRNDQLILMGGDASEIVGVWVFDAGGWVDRCALGECTNAPLACSDASMTFDEARGVMVLLSRYADDGDCEFGGSVEAIRTWDGSSFSLQELSDTRIAASGLQPGSKLAYHHLRQSIVRAGGVDPFSLTPSFGEPCELRPLLDGYAWMSIQNTIAVASVGDGATYDESLGAVVGFFDQEFGRDRVQYWNGNRFRSSTQIPSQLQDDGIAISHFDSESTGPENLLLGAQDSNPNLLSIWAYTINEFNIATFSERWSMASCVSPPNCDGPFGGGQKMAWNGSEVIAFGGGGPDLPSQTWAWTGSAWEARCTGACVAPPGRIQHAMVGDPASGDIYLYGGSSEFGVGVRHEVWRFRNGVWAELGESQVDVIDGILRGQAAMSFDSERESLVVFGGTLEDPFFVIPGGAPSCGVSAGALCGGPLEYDVVQESWSLPQAVDLLGDGEPLPRFGASLTYDQVRGHHVLSGGQGQNLDASSETWLYHSGARSRPAHIFNVSAAARSSDGALADTLVSARLRWVAEANSLDGSEPGELIENENLALWMWQYDTWIPLETTVASVSGTVGGASLYTADIDLSAPSRGLFTGTAGNLHFAASPEGLNHKSYATIVTDYVELTVRYHAD